MSAVLAREIGTFIVDLSDAVGVRLVDEKPSPYTYEAGRIYIRRAKSEPVTVSDLSRRIGVRRDVDDLAHEIAHFQVCPRHRVTAPDFGLGFNGFSSMRAELLVSQRTADVDEHRAMVLGFYHLTAIMDQVPRLVRGRLADLGYVSWRAFASDSGTLRVRGWLESRGLVREGKATTATVHGQRFALKVAG